MGVAHAPAESATTGLLTVVAGGPQYRAGVGRGLVSMARELAAGGVPVMRFDYRGMGDSSGTFRGFEHIGEDLACAVDAFRRAVPGLERVVLWGGCDAASGILIHAAELPGVVAVAVGNPWVSSEATQAAVVRKHYLRRLGEKSFWLKVLRLEYNPLDYLREAAGWVRKTPAAPAPAQRDTGAPPLHFTERMLRGLRRFEGPVLLFMSGRSLLSREFDELAQRRPEWREAVAEKVSRRVDLPDADQAFSSRAARAEVTRVLAEWLRELEGH